MSLLLSHSFIEARTLSLLPSRVYHKALFATGFSLESGFRTLGFVNYNMSFIFCLFVYILLYIVGFVPLTKHVL